MSRAEHYDLRIDSSPRKVEFSACIKCLRIRAQVARSYRYEVTPPPSSDSPCTGTYLEHVANEKGVGSATLPLLSKVGFLLGMPRD